MTIIHKFQLTSADFLPEGKVLLIAQQNDSPFPYLWLEYDPDIAVETAYRIFGTGQSPTGEHIGSAICGDYVWHVYKGARS